MNRLKDPGSSLEVVQADFFSIPPDWNGRFDTILDYTNFCAITPERRAEYADLVARTLKSKGKYIILAFPVGSRPGGPPFTLQPDAIVRSYVDRGFRLSHRENPLDSVPGRAGYEELLILEKA